jgi:hypothetical protein
VEGMMEEWEEMEGWSFMSIVLLGFLFLTEKALHSFLSLYFYV